MVGHFGLPPAGFGPGSQPSDVEGGELEYMPMPQDMRTFQAQIPDVEIDASLNPALALLREIAEAAGDPEGGNRQFDLSHLDEANRKLIAETMGEGEVAMRLHGIPAVAVQESVFAGVWVMSAADRDVIEVGPVPELALKRAVDVRNEPAGPSAETLPGVVNAPSIVVELFDRSENFDPKAEMHTVNLSLLPHTEQDLEWLDLTLGKGSVEILSRGYGNCRVAATAVPYVWRVQFFNSMDTLILDTYEVCEIPEVAIAASEDLADSGKRLLEVLEVIQ
ncbi:MAG: hydrogenase expression/formation protein [Pseudomonadota bacterium]